MPLNFGQSLHHMIFLPPQIFDKGLYLFIYLFIHLLRFSNFWNGHCSRTTLLQARHRGPLPPSSTLRPLLFSNSTVGCLLHRASSAADSIDHFLVKRICGNLKFSGRQGRTVPKGLKSFKKLAVPLFSNSEVHDPKPYYLL